MQGLYDACNQKTSGTSDRMLMTVRGARDSDATERAQGRRALLGRLLRPSPTPPPPQTRGGGGTGSSATTRTPPVPVASLLPTSVVAGQRATRSSMQMVRLATFRYIGFDEPRKGWTNVAGTAVLNGTACESRDRCSCGNDESHPLVGCSHHGTRGGGGGGDCRCVLCCLWKKQQYDGDEKSQCSTSCTPSSSAGSSFFSRGTSYTQ